MLELTERIHCTRIRVVDQACLTVRLVLYKLLRLIYPSYPSRLYLTSNLAHNSFAKFFVPHRDDSLAIFRIILQIKLEIVRDQKIVNLCHCASNI